MGKKLNQCCKPGTFIATEEGSKLVEDIQVGDKVIISDASGEISIKMIESSIESFQDILSGFNKANIPLRKDDIDPIYFIMCEEFSIYVIKCTLSEDINYDYDPPWDHSGELIKKDMCESHLLSYLFQKYDNLDEWSVNTYTGQTEATYVSGLGLSHKTYEAEIISIVESFIYKKIENILGLNWESDELDILSMDLALFIIEKMSTIPLRLAWDLTKEAVRKKIKKEDEEFRIRQEIYQNRVLLVNDITTKYFSKYLKCHIVSYNKKSLVKTIHNIFPCLTVGELEAIEHVGLKLNLSNKVLGIIQDLSKNELESRY